MSLFNKKKDSVKTPSSVPSVSTTPPKTALKPVPVPKVKKVFTVTNNNIFRNVLLYPVITEKATFMEGDNNCYSFEIDRRANKISVKKAIKEIYNFSPIKVNIIKTKGKKIRYGRSHGKTKNRKRALVFLKKGDQIEFVKKG